MRGTPFCTRALLAAAAATVVFGPIAAPALAQDEMDDQPMLPATRQNLDAPGRGTSELVVPEAVIDETTMSVSATIGLDYNTHFVSYGLDVWGAGTDFGDNATFNPFAEVTLDFEAFSFTAGTWQDINDNAESGLGGQIQEQDFYFSVGTGYEDFAFSGTYQVWHYAGGVEQVIDIGISYDDSALFDGNFAFNPSFLAHKRLAASTETGVPGNGWIFLLGVEPAVDLIPGETYPVSLSIPVTVAFSDDEFYADGGFAYVSVGAQFAVPLAFIPTDLGEWGLSAGVTAYFTEEDVIGNVDDSFLTGNVGVSLAF